jgi:hypothetical protein
MDFGRSSLDPGLEQYIRKLEARNAELTALIES